MSWTTCSCGHIAQDHNKLDKLIRFEDAETHEYGCDRCDCKSYDGHQLDPDEVVRELHQAVVQNYQIHSKRATKIYVVTDPDNHNRPLKAFYSMTPTEQEGWESEGFEVCETEVL